MASSYLRHSLVASMALLAVTALWRIAAASALKSSLALSPALLHGIWLVVAAAAYAYIAATVVRARKMGEPFSPGWLVPTAILGVFLPVLVVTLSGLLLAK